MACVAGRNVFCACESFERSANLKRLLPILHTSLQNFPRSNDLAGKAGWAKSLQLRFRSPLNAILRICEMGVNNLSVIFSKKEKMLRNSNLERSFKVLTQLP